VISLGLAGSGSRPAPVALTFQALVPARTRHSRLEVDA
jgi:hypothetical protein